MITDWKISNFKSIRECVQLELAPLTVFSGANSSGKSTFIQSILVVSQSLGSAVWQDPLVLNGRFINLGRPEDVLHHGNDSEDIEIGFTLQTSGGHSLQTHAVLKKTTVKNSRAIRRPWARLEKCLLQLEKQGSTRKTIELQRHSLDLPKTKVEISESLREQIDEGLFDYRIAQPQLTDLGRGQIEEVISASPKNFLPGETLMRIKPKIRDLTADIEHLTDAMLTLVDHPGASAPYIDWDREVGELARLVFQEARKHLHRRKSGKDHLHDLLYELAETSMATMNTEQFMGLVEDKLESSKIEDLARRLTGALPAVQRQLLTLDETQLEVQEFPSPFNEMVEQTCQILGRQVFYLGPLRDDPKAIYAIPSQPNQRDVGLKGEYSAAMLDIYGNQQVQYPVPPAVDEKFKGGYAIAQGSLNEAILAWLCRMGLADGIVITETSKVGYQLNVRLAQLEKSLDLTSVGVGISQVLPILAMSFLTPKGSILIFEQPEVHLHPKVQSVLADLFLSIAHCDKQCIVETHSVYLIRRLQRRICETEDDSILAKLRIYFAERKNSISQFTSVKPNEYGAILQWPDGFFDEAEKEAQALLEASAKKRQSKRRKPRAR